MRPRVGIVDYLNSRPLAWSFLEERRGAPCRPVLLPPAAVAAELAAGRLEVGLVPSIELQRIPGLRVIPGLCIAATREVRSVLLVQRVELARVRRVALDENSRTSAALVKILIRELTGREPEWTVAPPRLEKMLDGCDAALVIGDPALGIDRRAWQVLDLAATWRELTGLPFVFAVWAVRPGFEIEPELVSLFHASLRRGLQSMDELVSRAVEELGLERQELRDYLTRNLSYRLGAEELAGLEEFFRRARRLGLVGEPRPLRFLETAAGAG